MGEDEGGAGDVADLGGAGGDVLQGAPAAGKQGEPAFAEAAQGPLDGVAGTGINIEFTAVWRLLDRDVQADASAFIARIGQGGKAACGGPVDRWQGVAAGGGDVVYRARFRRGVNTAWTLPPWTWALPWPCPSTTGR